MQRGALWKKVIVGKFGEEAGGWNSYEGMDMHGDWKQLEKDRMLLKVDCVS